MILEKQCCRHHLKETSRLKYNVVNPQENADVTVFTIYEIQQRSSSCTRTQNSESSSFLLLMLPKLTFFLTDCVISRIRKCSVGQDTFVLHAWKAVFPVAQFPKGDSINMALKYSVTKNILADNSCQVRDPRSCRYTFLCHQPPWSPRVSPCRWQHKLKDQATD